MRKFIAALIIATAFTISATPQNIQHTGNFSGTVIQRVSSEYLLYLPQEYSEASRELWPLVVFLHGSGERGNDLERVKVNGPPRLVQEGKNFPFILLSPQCPLKQDFDTETVFSLIEHIVKEYKADADRIYVTGLSMGGKATWDLAMAHPGYFAAIAPICGRINRYYPEKAAEIKDLPVWVFHGAMDDVVPILDIAKMVNALKNAGSSVKFTIYPTTGHDAWTETYNNPDFYDWLLKQRRGLPMQ